MHGSSSPGFARPDFRAVFEASPNPYLVLSPDAPRFTISGVNDAYLRATGTERAAILGRGLFEVFPDNPADPSADGTRNLQASLNRVLATGLPDRMPGQHYDIPRRGEAGGGFEERHWQPLNTPVLGPDGEVTSIIHHVEDVTAAVIDRRRAAESLGVSEARFRDMADNAPVVMWVTDPSGRCIFLNKRWYEFTGQMTVEAEGFGWLNATHPDDKAEAERVFVTSNAARAPFRVEYRLRRADGTYRWSIDFATPRFAESGEYLGYVGSVIDIDERREAEERLRESEERYRSLFNSIDAGFCVIEVKFDGAERPVDYRFLEVNPAFERQTGLANAEGRWVSDLAPSLERHWFDTYGRVALTGEPARFENQAVPLGRWFEVHAFRVGEPAAHRVAILFNDISGRMRVEEALRQSEAKFQAIANSIDQMIWSTRSDGYHDYYNQRWYDYTGVPEGSTDGAAWSGMFHPEDQDHAWQVWQHSLETGEPYRIEYRLRHRSGQYRWVLGRAQPVRSAGGAITRWFGTCTDIQDIVEAREVLARSREELEREIAERTAERDRIWQNSTELMGVFGFDGHRRAINPAWSRVLGFDEQTLLDTPFMEITHPEDRGRLKQAVERLAAGERLVGFEDRLRHADGSYRQISWTGVPGDGIFYAIGRDVTEQRQAQDALRQAQKMEAIGQLTGGVAHDFNNLLTIIRSSTDLLRRPDLPEERRRRYVDAIADTVDRASKLTGQLLAFARRQALKPEVFDVPDRIRSIIDMLRTIVGSRIQIVTDITCDRCFVEADVSQFETALVNMAVNARDAMDGEGTLRVRVEDLSAMPAVRGHGGGSGRFVGVSLVDTGSGIAADMLPHIFEPFFTTKEIGRGTGLGLSQVYGFAKQSGGDIDVASAIGRGTTFTLYLPRAERDAAEAEAQTRGPVQAPAGGGRRVLVVEDNVEVGTFSTQLLQDLGYETAWAANAEDALRLLAESGGRFDAVFSDVVMPGMSGVELGQEIRRRHPKVPVILTSGYSHVLAEKGRHGFELVQKPYAVEELSRVLRRVARGGTRPG